MKPVANDRFVSEEGVLHASLLVVPRSLLPLTAPDLLHPHHGAITSARSTRPRCRTSRWNDDFRSAGSGGLVDCDRVISRICCEARDVSVNFIDEAKNRPRIVNIPVSQDLGDNHASSIDAEMKFLPSTLAAATMLDSGPLAFPDDGKPSAVQDEMHGAYCCGETEIDIELLAPAGDGGVVRSFEVESHQRQD